MRKAAFVICVIGTVLNAAWFTPFSLIWCIPMTVTISKACKQERKLSTGFKVYTLLFVSLLGGIILLCDRSLETNKAST